MAPSSGIAERANSIQSPELGLLRRILAEQIINLAGQFLQRAAVGDELEFLGFRLHRQRIAVARRRDFNFLDAVLICVVVIGHSVPPLIRRQYPASGRPRIGWASRMPLSP